jgi:solute:Na+ symporter, SSS family
MNLSGIDLAIVILFMLFSLTIGIVVAKRAGKSSSEYFLSGRHMPWWLLGVSMVATTFSTDTPNLVTDFVRSDGVAGNWRWWAFLLTGMLTVFVYAKLWRRAGLTTDVQFYELRYSGKPAAFLRGFRAAYMSFVYSIITQAAVSLAAIKIGQVMLGLEPWQTLLIGGGITAIYSMLGGLRGVLYADFFQFIIAMCGSIGAAYVALGHPEVGGLSNLLANERVQSQMSLLPDFSNLDLAMGIFIIPLAVQWWSVWYPGSEPGGGSYVAQRTLAAKNERHAMGANLLFTVAHYALRPWPWIIVALCSIIVFPDLPSLQAAFPNMSPDRVKNDLAYSAMLTYLPVGLRGIVVASLVAAYMSTVSTQLNLVSSYVTTDLYKRFMDPDADERRLVLVGRIMTVLLVVLSSLLALTLSHSIQAFQILLQIGAGTGLIFILRWFWWRINAFSEIVGMAVAFLVAIYFHFVHERMLGLPPLEAWQVLLIGVAITTVGWIAATMLTRPTDERILRRFYRIVRPGGPGWQRVRSEALRDGEDLDAGKTAGWDVPVGIICMLVGCAAVYGALFATGSWIYGRYTHAIVLTIVAVVSAIALMFLWQRLQTQAADEDARFDPGDLMPTAPEGRFRGDPTKSDELT